ncbi:MAG: nucleotidyltransferase domain-containing protein [Nitrospirae bacterium]|nr:nucleotidyltransferase domain-containing protein [Nitrospirota bacterium]
MNEHAVKRLTECLCKYPVIIAYLFGSEAKGTSGALSDIDIAVLVDRNIDKSERFNLRLRLSNELSSIINRMVDLAVLNDSPVQLSYEVIKHGKLIFCKDKSMKVDLEVEILSKYLDRRYYDKRHAELTLERIASRGL